MDNQDSEIFTEVNDAFKRQQIIDFWEENKNWIIGGVIGSIIATGGMAGWRQWEKARDIKATTELSKIVETLSIENTGDIEKFITSTNKNQATTARFILASNYAEAGKLDKAIEVYNEIASTMGIDKAYKDFAKFLSLKYQAKDGDVAKILSELENLTSPKCEWRHMALELKATLLAKGGNYKDAVAALDVITSDPNAPVALKDRAVKLAALYNAESDNK